MATSARKGAEGSRQSAAKPEFMLDRSRDWVEADLQYQWSIYEVQDTLDRSKTPMIDVVIESKLEGATGMKLELVW